ncbi:MAG: adenosine kinase [Desulfobacteraceae bacterium]|nr:adenosine kinase [Desulfobacteraceae bacterium]
MSENKSTRITGIGAALIDLLINEKDEFLENIGKEKGGMTLVENSHEIESILDKTDEKAEVVIGGAACNTIVGVAKLGGDAKFIGKRGKDEYGDTYEDQLLKNNVIPDFFLSNMPTGKVLSIITEDAQRSMITFLGASSTLDPDKITSEMFKETKIAVIEGYLFFNRDLMLAALRAAKEAKALIALDLASFEVVKASKDILDDIILKYVDILIANEDEAEAFTGLTDEMQALDKMSKNVEYAVLKVGEKGSFISHKGKVIKIDPLKGANAIDTTGAGDLWAAGFLFGLAHGYSIEQSGKIASACGYEVVQVIGAQIPEHGWKRIKQILV